MLPATYQPKKKFKPSPYQKDIFNWVIVNMGSGNHLTVQAVAGSGKSTTGIEMFELLPQGLESVFVAFNRAIADELKAKLPEGANAMTYHSLGFRTLKRSFPRVIPEPRKVEFFLKDNFINDRWLYYSTKKLVGLCKGHRSLDFSDKDLERMAFSHDVDLYEEKDSEIKWKIFHMVRAALSHSLDDTRRVDYDDMIWMPLMRDDISFYQYPFMFVDEVQDTNKAQLELAISSITRDGTICGVGDRRQSIYRFRGADETAMDNLKSTLNAEELPLSISYRCPVVIGELVNKKFPDVQFEVPSWAEQGTIGKEMSYDVEKKVQAGDMLLCRVNAPLVPMAFSLIRGGIRATIRGRNIGEGLVSLIKKSQAESVKDLFVWLSEWRDKEIEKAFLIGAEDKVQYIHDRFDTLYAMSENANTVADIAKRCDEMFSDTKSVVTLSSIHKAKGLEADNVYILKPDLLPHPAAKSPEDKKQESNLEYVAITRAKKSLVYVY